MKVTSIWIMPNGYILIDMDYEMAHYYTWTHHYVPMSYRMLLDLMSDEGPPLRRIKDKVGKQAYLIDIGYADDHHMPTLA